MSEVVQIIVTLAQFVYILWPLFILVTAAYALWGFGFKGLGRRMYSSLLYTWTILFGVWVVTLFAEGPNMSLLPEPYNSLIFFGGFGLLAGGSLLRWLRPKISFRSIGDELTGHVLGRTQARLNLRQAHALEDLKRLDPAHFEELVAELYRAEGHQARHMGQSGDHGVDVEVITSSGERWIVQCKRYRDTVGEEIVRELFGTLHHEKAHRAVLVTTANTTTPAENWARGKPIDLIDGTALMHWVERVAARTRPNLFDRLAWAVQAYFRPSVTFAGYSRTQPPQPAGSFAGGHSRSDRIRAGRSNGSSPSPARQPAILRPIERQIVTVIPGAPPPLCPRCRVPMVLSPRRPGDRSGRLLYRCSNYPGCRVVLEPVWSTDQTG